MSQITGYLFLDSEGTRVVFIPDEADQSERLDWSVLVERNFLELFISEFRAQPTRDGALRGWRIEASLPIVKRWLQIARRHGSPARNYEIFRDSEAG